MDARRPDLPFTVCTKRNLLPFLTNIVVNISVIGIDIGGRCFLTACMPWQRRGQRSAARICFRLIFIRQKFADAKNMEHSLIMGVRAHE